MQCNEDEIKAAEQHRRDHLNETLTIQDWATSWEAAEETIISTKVLTDKQTVEQIRLESDEDDT